jgi:N-acetylglucosamine kinase-like BadF-type ATPase
MSRTSLVLGVDGGGTKTIGLIADMAGNILASRETGATNPNVVGFDESAKTLSKVILGCCEDVRCSPDELRSVVLGLAGADSTEFRERITDDLNALIVKSGSKALNIGVETDARVALEGAFNGGAGVVVIAGTGSIVIGKTVHGAVVSVGGWGRILGDEGSGFAIGRDGIRALTLSIDRRGEPTKLKELIAEKFHWTSREDIITAVYQQKFDPAQLAPLVMEAAVDHDVVCQRILQTAAAQIVEQVRVVVMQMGILRKILLVMSGGLLQQGTVFANVLHLKIMKSLPQVELCQSMNSPAQGAVHMALERVKKV